MKRMNLAVIAGSGILLLAACAPMTATNSSTASSLGAIQSNGPALTGKMELTVRNSSGSVIYADGSTVNTSLAFTSGQTYNVVLNITGSQPGVTFSLVSTRTDIPNGAVVSYPLQLGSNTFTAPAQGDYSWEFQATAANATPVTQYYIAQVSCSNPTFTASSLNASAITATSSGTNLYSFSAAGVATNANGTPPYTYAWDPTGTGIQDTAFSTSTSTSNTYVNYVSSRNVGLLVKDSCNTTVSVSQIVDLPYTEPTMPGNVFIYGQTSNATGTASGDSRIDGVTYLATNAGGNDIVQPQYSKGSFEIYSMQNYQMPSSVKFGMDIQVTGITDTLNVSAGTGTVSAANAKLKQVTYKTDQAGDQSPAVSLSSTNCTLSNQGATVKFISGQPCSGGQTGDTNQATVEVWGHYTCAALTDAGGSVQISGDFDGYTDIVDSCSGGGGGGGGVAPIEL